MGRAGGRRARDARRSAFGLRNGWERWRQSSHRWGLPPPYARGADAVVAGSGPSRQGHGGGSAAPAVSGGAADAQGGPGGGGGCRARLVLGAQGGWQAPVRQRRAPMAMGEAVAVAVATRETDDARRRRSLPVSATFEWTIEFARATYTL